MSVLNTVIKIISRYRALFSLVEQRYRGLPMSRFARTLCLTFIFVTLAACSTEDSGEELVTEKQESALAKLDDLELAKTSLMGTEFAPSSAPEVKSYKEQISRVLEQQLPILALNGLPENKSKAQEVFLAYPGLKPYLYIKNSAMPMRVEVMTVSPALPSAHNNNAVCNDNQCFEITAYNFFNGTAISSVVDIQSNKILRFDQSSVTQPDLSERLVNVAKKIASDDPLVLKELAKYLEDSGKNPDTGLEPLMAGTKTSLNNSFCERSNHLCVAPTYVLGSQALWVIVDLTDFKVAGLRWTNVGEQQSLTPVTEKTIANQYIYENFCLKETALKRGDWQFNYQITSSDGLRISDIKFRGKPVLDSMKVVDWNVSYSNFDGFGYADATGCPMFSSALVTALEPPVIEAVSDDSGADGFAITQDFQQVSWPAACHYRYQERYEFFADGRINSKISNLGRGCGASGIYRPIVRIELPQDQATSIETWENGNWANNEFEDWRRLSSSDSLNEARYSHRLTQRDGSYLLLEPSTGTAGQDDEAYFYTTVGHKDRVEGSADLVTLGKCCNGDHRQGPEKFIEPAEKLENKPLVVWYVPQLENNVAEDAQRCWAESVIEQGVAGVKTWPCTAGMTLHLVDQ